MKTLKPLGAYSSTAELYREAREVITALHERLEDNYAWQDGKRVAVEPGSIPDGISCRDETIKLQDKQITALERQRQIDSDGTEVGVSRQAVDEAILRIQELESRLREVKVALKIAKQLSNSLENGFVRCSYCGEQEDTKDLDFAPELAAALSALAPDRAAAYKARLREVEAELESMRILAANPHSIQKVKDVMGPLSLWSQKGLKDHDATVESATIERCKCLCHNIALSYTEGTAEYGILRYMETVIDKMTALAPDQTKEN